MQTHLERRETTCFFLFVIKIIFKYLNKINNIRAMKQMLRIRKCCLSSGMHLHILLCYVIRTQFTCIVLIGVRSEELQWNNFSRVRIISRAVIWIKFLDIQVVKNGILLFGNTTAFRSSIPLTHDTWDRDIRIYSCLMLILYSGLWRKCLITSVKVNTEDVFSPI